MSLLNKREVQCLAEVVLNGIAGQARTKLTPECVRHCHRNRGAVKSLAYDRLPWKQRRDILRTQVGRGWFAPLLSTVVESLGRNG